MKTILLSLCLILATNIHSQTKGDNQVIIENFQELSKIKKALIIEGYELKSFSEEDGYFSTEYQPIEGSVHAHNLNVKIKGYLHENNLILSADYKSEYSNGMGGMTQASGKATYHKRELIAKRLAFDELNKVAKKINKVVIYNKES